MKPAVSKILAFTFFFTTAVSCNKSASNTSAPAKSTTILLTQASWKVQTIGIDQDKNGVAESDVTSSVPACQLDNTYTFKTDSSGTMDEGVTKCASADPQSKPFTWGFNGENALTGTFSFTNGDATILSMNDTTMIVAYDDDFGTTTSYHLLATLKH